MFWVTKHIEFCYGHRLLNYDGNAGICTGTTGGWRCILRRTSWMRGGWCRTFSESKGR